MSRAVLFCGLWLALASPILFLSEARAQQTSWRAISGQLPPFSYQDKGRPAGFMVELIGEAAHRSGASLKIEYYPWARAVAMAQAGPDTLIFPLARTPEREGEFAWILPLYAQRYVVIAPRSTQLAADGGIPSHARIGVIRGTTLIEDLPALAGKKVLRGRDYPNLFRMLDEKMIEVIVGPASIVQASMKRIGREAADYRVGATLGRFELWLAASRDLPAARAAALEEATRSMRRDGTYDRLLRRHELDEDARGDTQLRSGGGSRLSPRSPGLPASPSAATANPE